MCWQRKEFSTYPAFFLLKSFWGNQTALVDERTFLIDESYKCTGKEHLGRCCLTALDGILDSDHGCQELRPPEGWNGCRGMRAHRPHVLAHCHQICRGRLLQCPGQRHKAFLPSNVEPRKTKLFELSSGLERILGAGELVK